MSKQDSFICTSKTSSIDHKVNVVFIGTKELSPDTQDNNKNKFPLEDYRICSQDLRNFTVKL